jgi:hypothetical protein
MFSYTDLHYINRHITSYSKEVGLEVNPEKIKYMLVKVSEGRTEAEHKDREWVL